MWKCYHFLLVKRNRLLYPPDESDPYFPDVAEQTGIIDIIAVNLSGEQIKQEMQLNHMSLIPNESFYIVLTDLII
jgi:hypothetical protein